MTVSAIDVVTRRRVFGRFVASAAAAAAKALVDGKVVAVWVDDRLYRQYPDGHRVAINVENADASTE